MARVVVIGGGISGLVAAWELSGGAVGPGSGTPEVTVLESSARLGGALASVDFAGRRVDVGPDGFLGRRPEALSLCRELGLDEALVPIGGRRAGVWARGKVRPLPDGLALGIPTRFWPAARSGILGLRGQFGLALDALAPRPDVRGPIGDRAIGPLVVRKLGRRVTERLVDPLIGGIHAGSVSDMSAAAIYPPLLAAAQRRGSLMRALRAEVPAPVPAGEAEPLFWTLDGGMAALVDALTAALQSRGVTIALEQPAEQLSRGVTGWVVTAGGVDRPTDRVILAVPAPTAAGLLAPIDDEATTLLGGIDYASVSLATFQVPVDQLATPLVGTGFLVPRSSPHPDDKAGWIVTACTYLSQKWPTLARDGEVLLRASLGRFGDDRTAGWSDADITARVWGELGLLMGVSGTPSASMLTRWPLAFPQYRVHHLVRTTGIESAIARLGGLAVAGAAYRGVGIPACIASGKAAAQAVL
ncbi:MAG TPA: protoporphyrinogen oxidase [Acidimicrobiales bacterium]|nr:protoporphyrinogen oxidase [Acidimicrobiales bacterium]